MRLETLKDKSRFEKAFHDVRKDILYTHHLVNSYVYENEDKENTFEKLNPKSELIPMWKQAKTSKEFIQELVMRNLEMFEDVCWATRKCYVLDLVRDYQETNNRIFDKFNAKQNIECFIGGVYVLFEYSDCYKECETYENINDAFVLLRDINEDRDWCELSKKEAKKFIKDNRLKIMPNGNVLVETENE